MSLTGKKRIVAPAAVGLAAGLITKQIQKSVIDKKNVGDKEDDKKEYSMGNIFLTGAIGLATAVGTQQLKKSHDAQKSGLTPIMIVAVTKKQVYLLDWKCTHNNKGKGPTEILGWFNLNDATIKNHTNGLVYHTIDIKEDGSQEKM